MHMANDMPESTDKPESEETPDIDLNLEGQPVQNGPGLLYLVGTPIGNLGDMTPRAASILGLVDYIAAEDTRRTLRLLNHLGIRKHLESYHEHNWKTRQPLLISHLLQGRSIALVSDAGMPCVSDPGSQLVDSCVQMGIRIIVVPGPSAAITALIGSGLPSGRFVFEGFLPASGRARKEQIRQIATERRTSLLYEAPHRLSKTLSDLAAAGLAERRLAVARELTKRHEEFLRMTIGEAAAFYSQNEPRGEFVLVLEGLDSFQGRNKDGDLGEPNEKDQAAALLLNLLEQGYSSRDAARLCAEKTGRKRNELYQMAVKLARENESAEDR
jgi:16S rRNA (cytidine1402-2'-O)-methyltransferase